MSAATKSALLLAVTLLLGVMIGVFGAGALARHRFGEPWRPGPGRGGRGGAGGLERHMLETIQPHDSIQEAKIRPVLLRTAQRNRRIIGDVNIALRASIDSMKSELAPMLDAEQRARLDEVTRALPPVGGPGGRRRPPPPPEDQP